MQEMKKVKKGLNVTGFYLVLALVLGDKLVLTDSSLQSVKIYAEEFVKEANKYSKVKIGLDLQNEAKVFKYRYNNFTLNFLYFLRSRAKL